MESRTPSIRRSTRSARLPRKSWLTSIRSRLVAPDRADRLAAELAHFLDYLSERDHKSRGFNEMRKLTESASCGIIAEVWGNDRARPGDGRTWGSASRKRDGASSSIAHPLRWLRFETVALLVTAGCHGALETIWQSHCGSRRNCGARCCALLRSSRRPALAGGEATAIGGSRRQCARRDAASFTLIK